jgi:hypothetical protein
MKETQNLQRGVGNALIDKLSTSHRLQIIIANLHPVPNFMPNLPSTLLLSPCPGGRSDGFSLPIISTSTLTLEDASCTQGHSNSATPGYNAKQRAGRVR